MSIFLALFHSVSSNQHLNLSPRHLFFQHVKLFRVAKQVPHQRNCPSEQRQRLQDAHYSDAGGKVPAAEAAPGLTATETFGEEFVKHLF